MHYKYLATLILVALPLSAGLNVWFDIHGVLLHEDIATQVKLRVIEKLAAQQKTDRGLKDHPLFKLLCTQLDAYPPLANVPVEREPIIPFPEAFPLPFETYALFSGMYAPETIFAAISTMLEAHPCEDERNQLLLTTLVEVLFDRERLTASMVPLPEGIALLNFFLNKPDCTVRIYSNAPASWVDLYPEVFPDLFSKIAPENLWCSGKTTLLKPLKEAFDFMKAVSTDTHAHTILIDDTALNVADAQVHGITGIHFDYQNPEAAINALVSADIISAKEAEEVLASCTLTRTTRIFGEPLLFGV